MGLKKSEVMLHLIEALQTYTDENHQLSSREITDILNLKLKQRVEIAQHTVTRYLKELEDYQIYSIESIKEKEGVPIKYFYDGRLFELHELRIMMDAIVSAGVLTKNDKQTIISKIQQLTSQPLANKLKNQVHIHDTSSSNNAGVKYYIYHIHNAIHEQKVIEFLYGKYDVNKQIIYSNEGRMRRLEPYALHWDNDNYYLIGKNMTGEIRHFRIDRIKEVKVTEESFIKDPYFDATAYTEKLFNMFTGEVKFLKIQFANELINPILDRFGLDANIEVYDDDSFLLRTEAAISAGLISWILKWGSRAKVIDPIEVAEQIKVEAKKTFTLYDS